MNYVALSGGDTVRHDERIKQYEDKHGIELPVCPFCQTKMIPVRDTDNGRRLDCWLCHCENLDYMYGG